MNNPRVFLDIDIGDPIQHASHQAAYDQFVAFVAEKGAVYGVSPGTEPNELSEDVAEMLLEAYNSDPAWATQPVQRMKPAELRAGRVVLEIFGAECPKATSNFLALVKGNVVSKTLKKPLHYRGIRFHRIVKGFMAQAGVMNEKTGAGESALPGGGTFNDDKPGLKLKHSGPGVLALGNSGRANTNTSHFYITLKASPQLDGKHVVFGKVVEGMELLERIDREAGVEDGQEPRVAVVIAECGVL
jgi:cyclophilin family peptidyl-prolyl cis-trans isomerase